MKWEEEGARESAKLVGGGIGDFAEAGGDVAAQESTGARGEWKVSFLGLGG